MLVSVICGSFAAPVSLLTAEQKDVCGCAMPTSLDDCCPGLHGEQNEHNCTTMPLINVRLLDFAVPMGTMSPDKYRSWLDSVESDCSCCLGSTSYITDCYLQYRNCTMIREVDVLGKLCKECPGASTLTETCPVSACGPYL